MIRVNTDSRSSTNVTRNYKWNVKITQIDCTSKLEEIRSLKGNIIVTEIAFLFICTKCDSKIIYFIIWMEFYIWITSFMHANSLAG